MRWATRRHCHVDRAACAWLIRRFVDPDATFVFVDDPDDILRNSPAAKIQSAGRNPHEVDEQDREQCAPEEVRGRRRERNRAKMWMPKDEACAFDDLAGEIGDASLVSLGDGGWAPVLDRRQERSRREKGERVRDEREGCAHELDQEPGDCGPRDLSSRAAQLELRVAFDELSTCNEPRQVGVCCDIEEDRQNAVDQRDRVQVGERQGVE